MFINYKKATIELTTAEARRAAKIGTDKYKELLEAKRNFPNFIIKVVPTSKSKSSNDLKGLTYGFMEKYISIHGTEEQLKTFNELRFNTEMTRTGAASYGKIKQWFLENFPQIKAASASKKNKGVA